MDVGGNAHRAGVRSQGCQTGGVSHAAAVFTAPVPAFTQLGGTRLLATSLHAQKSMRCDVKTLQCEVMHPFLQRWASDMHLNYLASSSAQD